MRADLARREVGRELAGFCGGAFELMQVVHGNGGQPAAEREEVRDQRGEYGREGRF